MAKMNITELTQALTFTQNINCTH